MVKTQLLRILFFDFRASLNIPFPTKTHRERRESFKHVAAHDKTKSTSGSLPRSVPNHYQLSTIRITNGLFIIGVRFFSPHGEILCFLKA